MFEKKSFMFWHLGVDIVCKALRMPALTIAKNAGVDAHVVVEKVLNETCLLYTSDAADER